MFLFCLLFAMSLCASVYMCFVVTFWERADLLALVCGVLLLVCFFSNGILGQVWYLIVSIPHLRTLTYFVACEQQTHRSGCASEQPDPRLCYSYSKSIIAKLALVKVSFF